MENSPKIINEIGILAICAESTALIEFLREEGKNLNSLENTGLKVNIPNTTPNDS
jgi:hypothetical protein